VMGPEEVFVEYDQMQLLRKGVFPASGEEPERPWRPGDAKRRFKDLFGFTDRKRGMVAYVANAPFVVLLHEMLHASADPKFPEQLGADIDEGTTTILANLAATKAGRAIDAGYGAQQDIAVALVKVAGQRTLEEAYFRGNIAQLRATVDDVCGERTFNLLVDRLHSGEDIHFAMNRIDGKASGGSYTTLKISIIQRYLDQLWFISSDEWKRIRRIIHSASPSEFLALRDAIGPQIADKLWDARERGRLRLWLMNGAPDT